MASKKIAEKEMLRTYHIGIVMGISSGALTLLVGAVMIFMGLTGSIELVVEAKDINGRLLNASPGAFFAVLGAGIICCFKPSIKGKDKDKEFILHE